MLRYRLSKASQGKDIRELLFQHLVGFNKSSQRISFLFLMKSHLQSYPCPLQINSFWNLGFLLGITIILQIITGIFLGLHYIIMDGVYVIFILVEHHLSFFFYFYILEEL